MERDHANSATECVMDETNITESLVRSGYSEASTWSLTRGENGNLLVTLGESTTTLGAIMTEAGMEEPGCVRDVCVYEDKANFVMLNFAGGKRMIFPSEKFRMRDTVTMNISSTSPKKLQESISALIHFKEQERKEELSEDGELTLAQHQRNIQACYIGKFRMKLTNCVSPPPERLVRKVNDEHVSKICALLTADPDWGVTLTGLISKVQCQKKSDFRLDYLNQYTVEVIDGNHNLQALKRFQNENGYCVIERDILLYAGLSDEEAKSVGISRNQLTSNALPMTDMDYIKLIRQEIQTEYGEGRPGKDKRAIDFWNRVFPIIGLENNKKNRDNKRSWMTLAALPQAEFEIIENFDLKASRVYTMLKSVNNKDERIKLLKNLSTPAKTRTSKDTVSLEMDLSPKGIKISYLQKSVVGKFITVHANGSRCVYTAEKLMSVLSERTPDKNERINTMQEKPLNTNVHNGKASQKDTRHEVLEQGTAKINDSSPATKKSTDQEGSLRIFAEKERALEISTYDTQQKDSVPMSRLAQSLYDYVSEGESDEASKSEEYTKETPNNINARTTKVCCELPKITRKHQNKRRTMISKQSSEEDAEKHSGLPKFKPVTQREESHRLPDYEEPRAKKCKTDRKAIGYQESQNRGNSDGKLMDKTSINTNRPNSNDSGDQVIEKTHDCSSSTQNSTLDKPIFFEASFVPPQNLSHKLCPGTLLLCSPFNKKDYKKDDPFIYKVVQILNHKTCRVKGIMMIGSLGGKYSSGEELCSNSCTANINYEKILAVMDWDLKDNMPSYIVERIRAIY